MPLAVYVLSGHLKWVVHVAWHSLLFVCYKLKVELSVYTKSSLGRGVRFGVAYSTIMGIQIDALFLLRMLCFN